MSGFSFPEIIRLEGRIQAVKSDISNISNERWRASLGKDDKLVLEARTRAAEKMLENCDLLATYVSQFCPAVARDLSGQGRVLRSELEDVKRRRNEESLHAWYKAKLIPLVKRSEVTAHIAATSHQKSQRVANGCHHWPVASHSSH